MVGGWVRTAEPILPYTTAETMDAGWAWQIEHEHHVNRGYVYSSAAISDDDAAAEFLRKNPTAPQSPRVVNFRSGRYWRQLVGNVLAIGNAAGFVEPLEATALMVVCSECQIFVDMLNHSGLDPTPTICALSNRMAPMAGTTSAIFLRCITASRRGLIRHSGSTAAPRLMSRESRACSNSMRRMGRRDSRVTRSATRMVILASKAFSSCSSEIARPIAHGPP